MSYKIHFEYRPEYLYVYVKSDRISYTIAKQYWMEIVAVRQKRRYDRVLVDKDISKTLPIYDVFTLVSELARSGLTRVKLAIADRRYDPERSRFEETVSRNRGLHVKILRDFEQAEKWLLSR